MVSAAPLAQAWPFVHPGLAAAALAAALIPIVIHLINRRRFRRIPWAAMAFLIAANRRSARRVRLESLLLLALRMALVLAVGLAVARPFFANQRLGLQAGRVHRVFVLDDSLSMQAARPDSRTRFDAGLAMAQRLLSSFPPGDGVSLITTTHPAEPLIGSPTYDRRLAKEVLLSVKASQGSDDMVEALESVKKVLAESDTAPNNRALYLVSDFPRSVWEAETGGQLSPVARKLTEVAVQIGNSESNVVLARVEAGGSENLAVTDFRPETGLVGVQVPTSFMIKVTNCGAATVRDATLQLRRGTQAERREPLPPLAPGETVSTVVTTELSSPGSKLLEARVLTGAADSLPVDDARWLSLEARESVPILIVDGRPGPRLIEGQAGYLAVALAPHEETAGRPSISWGRTATNLYDVKVITEPELLSELSQPYDVVALCNVPRLTSEQWAALQSFVAAGGGAFISLGELVHIENYNRHGFGEGRGILPAPLERVVEAAPASERLNIQLGATPHPLFEDFADHYGSGLFSARVDRYFAIGPLQPTSEIPLHFSNNDPALILSRVGSGRVALWTTTANMEWNNLPGRGDFVPVMAKAVGALTPARGEHRNLLVGQTLSEILMPEEISFALKVTWGDSRSAEPVIRPMGDELAAQYGPLGSAGPISLSIGDRQQEFAVNVDVRESALQPAEQSAIAAGVGAPFRWMTETELPEFAGPGSVEWSSTLMWIALVMLLLEVWLAQRFAAAHPAREEKRKRPLRAGVRAGFRPLSGVSAP